MYSGILDLWFTMEYVSKANRLANRQEQLLPGSSARTSGVPRLNPNDPRLAELDRQRRFLARRLGTATDMDQQRMAWFNYVRSQNAQRANGRSDPVEIGPVADLSPMWPGHAPRPVPASSHGALVGRRRSQQLVMPPSLATLIIYQVDMSPEDVAKRRYIRDNIVGVLNSVKFRGGGGGEGDSDEDTATCVICRDDFNDGDNVTELECRHMFHTQCIEPWLMNEPSCPLCRKSLTVWLESLIHTKMKRRNDDDGPEGGCSGLGPTAAKRVRV